MKNAALLSTLVFSLFLSINAWPQAESNLSLKSSCTEVLPQSKPGEYEEVEIDGKMRKMPVKNYARPIFQECAGAEKAVPCSKERYRSIILENYTYPEEVRNNEVNGLLLFDYTITPDGQVGEVRFKNTLGYGCEQEVERLISLLPTHSPLEEMGKDYCRESKNLLIVFDEEMAPLTEEIRWGGIGKPFSKGLLFEGCNEERAKEGKVRSTCDNKTEKLFIYNHKLMKKIKSKGAVIVKALVDKDGKIRASAAVGLNRGGQVKEEDLRILEKIVLEIPDPIVPFTYQDGTTTAFIFDVLVRLK